MSNTDSIRRAIGQRVRKARTDVGLSQRDLAGLANVSNVHLCNIERGYSIPSVLLISDIAIVTGNEMGWFFQDVKLEEDGA